jgi:hypothetical protein
MSVLMTVNPAYGYTIVGYGTESCGTWTVNAEDITGLSVVGQASWLEGALSQANMFVRMTDGTDILQGADDIALIAWIGNYCRQHPLDTVAIATLKLIRELRQRARSSSQ